MGVGGGYVHPGVAGGGLVDIGLVDDEEDLGELLAKIPHAPQLFFKLSSSPLLLPLLAALTFFGRRRVTRVMPSMCFRPSLVMALRAFFSLREWTATEEPAGTLTSPSSPSDSSLDSSSSIWTFFFSGSSGSSSMRGLAILSVCG